MLRSALSIVVAFAVALAGAEPQLLAQYSGVSDPQTRSDYPTIAQAPDAQSPQPPSDDPNASDPNAAPPATTPEQDAASDQKHAVARASIVQGDVNVRRGDNGDMTAAVLNAPLLTGDRLETSNGSRAEIELDSANLVRIAPDTEVGLGDLEYHRYQVQLGAGTIIYRVLRNSSAQVEVDTPNIGFRPLSEGEFRISVLGDGTTQITARSGEGEIFGPQGSERLTHGQTLVVRGDASNPEFRSTSEIARDQFDDWSAHRDQDLLTSQSYRYVSQDVAGAEDLDQYGKWVPSQYGQVWTPQNEPSDWSPYSTGEWSWQDYYGWTWVDSAPWGWAPYHYGRWFYNGGYGWCWWPGAVGGFSYWSPALVGFFGWGGVGFGFGFGNLGWCALAPFERFHRWWGPGWYGRGWGGYGYGSRFRSYGNFARNVNVMSTYRNAAYRGGALMARAGQFGGPHQHFMDVPHGQLRSANMFQGGRMPVAPTRASYQFSNRAVTPNARLNAAGNQRFFQSAQWRNTATSRSFSQNAGSYRVLGRQSGAASPGNGWSRPGSVAQNGQSGRAPQAAHGVAPNMRSNSNYSVSRGSSVNRSTASGWQRFGDPSNGGALRQGFASGSERSGWHSFGQPEPYRTSPSNRANSTAGGRYSGPAATPRSSGSVYSRTPSFSQQPRYSAPSYSAPRTYYPSSRSASPSYSAPRYSSPAYSSPRYGAPTYNGGSSSRSYGAPSRSYSSPSRSYSAPRYSAPSGGGSLSGGFSGGGHSGGFSGGGGHGGGGGHHR